MMSGFLLAAWSVSSDAPWLLHRRRPYSGGGEATKPSQHAERLCVAWAVKKLSLSPARVDLRHEKAALESTVLGMRPESYGSF